MGDVTDFVRDVPRRFLVPPTSSDVWATCSRAGILGIEHHDRFPFHGFAHVTTHPLPQCRPAVALFALLLGSSACRLDDLFSGFDLCPSGPDRIASVSLQPAQVHLRPGDVAELTSIRVGTKGETILLCAPPLT